MKKFVDNYRHQGLRQKLVDELRRKGIANDKVLAAISSIPRHLFLDDAFDVWAYRDQAFQIDADQTISQPYTVAFQTDLLQIEPGHRILEVGTGSGYQACVLSALGARVYTIERQELLFTKTSTFLHQIGYSSIRTLFGDGYQGAPRFAPYDSILITAATDIMPTTLLEQLKDGASLVMPFGSGDTQTMKRITRNGDTYTEKSFGEFSFVPMLAGVGHTGIRKKQRLAS